MRKRIPTIITFFFVALFFFSLVFSFALAQDRKLEVEYPEIFGLKPDTVKTFLPDYVKYIFNFSLAIFGLVVFGVLIKGGALYMTSVGNPAKMQDAKEQIFSAFLGLVILLLSYLILTTINPQLVMFKVPLLTRPEICQNNDECLPGFECIKKECVRKKCATDAECPKGLSCDEETKVCVLKLERTLISIEIPLGQMIENGIWKKEEIEKTKKLLDEFENFLNTDKISNLNKSLKGLTDACQCGDLTPRCTKPEDWGTKVGCEGDPCNRVRDEIDKIKEINIDKMEQLDEYRKKITQQYASSIEEAEKFRKAYDQMQECLERGDLLTLNEYLAQAQFYDEQGWKTIMIPNYIPAKADPLTFYCAMGGTVFDPSQTSPVNFFNIPEGPTPTGMTAEEEIVESEPLSCPVEIPVGKLIEEVGWAATQTNFNLGDLIEYIDELARQTRNMDKFISQCDAKSCEANCGPIPNPCYGKCCAPTPCVGCNPFSMPPCLICTPANCASPGTQAKGLCVGKNPDPPYHSSACPRDDIQKTLDNIKKYEDAIFETLKDIKESFSYEPYVLETSEGSADLLNAVRAVTDTCFSKTTGDEEPTWMMLDCEMAVGNYRPDGSIIADCHPQSFFCCTADKNAAAKAPFFPTPIAPTPVAPTLVEVSPPSSYGMNNVPYFGQCKNRFGKDEPWRKVGYGCNKTTICTSGCGTTSAAMVLKYLGLDVDPSKITKWSLEHGGRCCGSGTCHPFFEKIAKAHGLKYKNFSGSMRTALDNIQYGPVIVSGRGAPPFTSGGHFIVLTGMDENYVYINDPNRPNLKKTPIEVFRRRAINFGGLIYK